MKNKVIIIGSGFTTFQIATQMEYIERSLKQPYHVNSLPSDEEWKRMAITKGEAIGFTQTPEIKFTEEEVKSAKDAYVRRLEEAAKDFSSRTGLGYHEICMAIQNLALSTNQSIQIINDLSISFNDIKPKLSYDEPKSKYINKPRHNFKRR